MTTALSQDLAQVIKTELLPDDGERPNIPQAASRFNAMTVAEDRASEMLGEYTLEFHRAKRSESDRRLREVLVGIKKKRREAAGARG